MLKKISAPVFAALLLLCTACGTMQKGGDSLASQNRDFLKKDPEAKEVFRVLISSDQYVVSQMRYGRSIAREDDNGGDKYMSSEVGRLDKIDEVREGVLSLWLFPDSGRIMKIRTQQPTYLIEVDKLLTEDIQRWNFRFPSRSVEPTRFDIKYRVILQKKLTDAEIIREVQDKMSEGN